MKKLLIALLATTFVGMAFAEAELKEVCHDKVDKAGKPVMGKDGKAVQECKKIKVHKKLEGDDAVPVKK
jgi:hypothetical protein